MRTHDDIMAALPPERRARIVARSDELKRDYLLRELREAVSKTQEQVAEAAGMKQGDVSRLERRSDAHISTLARYVEALGGELELVARFPNAPAMRIALDAGQPLASRVEEAEPQSSLRSKTQRPARHG